MKKYLLLTVILSSGVLFLSGCSNNAGNGALIGSLVGAGIGKSTANHHDKRALVGAVLGGMVGGAIGNEKDRAIANRNAAYSTGPVEMPAENGSSGAIIKHTHHYSSGSQTHSHTGGDVKHSHTRQYIEPDYSYAPANISTSLYISGGSYRNAYRHYPRHHRHHYWRPHHRPRWY